MSRLLDKISSFHRQAATGPVRVNVHDPSRMGRADRLVVFSCLVAAGVGLIASHIDAEDPTRKGSRAVQNQIIDRTSPGHPNDDIDQRMLHDDTAPRLNYVQVTYAGRKVLTLDEASRIALAKKAAEEKKLQQVGLSWRDVYGVIHAETAWIARDGLGKNGVVSSGLAQLEPDTARSLAVTDPHDPVQAIHATAALMKEAAIWSRSKISGLGLDHRQKAEKLREGVSIYYNLSTRGRNHWDGRNTHELPVETQRHIINTRDGARLAGSIENRLAREQSRRASQESPYMKATYGGRLEGAHTSPASVASMLMSMTRQQHAFTSAAHSVQALLDNKCPISRTPPPGVDLTSACLAAQPLSSYRMTAKEMNLKFGDMTLLGDFRGTPVFLADESTREAMALGDIRKDGSLAGGVVLTRGLVDALKGPGQADKLIFILAHEKEHLDRQHMFTTVFDKLLAQEIEADAGGVALMQEMGIPDERIEQATTFVMNMLHRDVPQAITPMIEARHAQLQLALSSLHKDRFMMAQR